MRTQFWREKYLHHLFHPTSLTPRVIAWPFSPHGLITLTVNRLSNHCLLPISFFYSFSITTKAYMTQWCVFTVPILAQIHTTVVESFWENIVGTNWLITNNLINICYYNSMSWYESLAHKQMIRKLITCCQIKY